MNAPNFLKLITATAMVSGSLFAQTPAASTDPVGFVSTTVPAQSDAVLAVPLYRAAEFKGVIQSISGNVLTVSGAPNWTANQFVQALPGQTKTYAVLIASGTKEGMIGRVTANGTSTLTVTLDSGDDLTGVKTEALNPGAADQIDVMPFWTAASLFSNMPDETELYQFDNSTSGINVSPTALLAYYDGFGWLSTLTFNDESHRPIRFGTGLIFRNNSNSSVGISIVGSVPMTKHRVKFGTLASNQAQDMIFSYQSPVPEALAQLNLTPEDEDQIFVYDNSAIGKNKSPSLLLIAYSNRWYNSLTFADVTDSVSFAPGSALIYRKAATASPQLTVWQDVQSYLNQ